MWCASLFACLTSACMMDSRKSDAHYCVSSKYLLWHSVVNYWAQNLLLNDMEGRSLCNKQGSFSSVAGVDFFVCSWCFSISCLLLLWLLIKTNAIYFFTDRLVFKSPHAGFRASGSFVQQSLLSIQLLCLCW